MSLAANVLLFGRMLRAAGLDVHHGRLLDAIRALEWVDVGSRADVAATLRSLVQALPERGKRQLVELRRRLVALADDQRCVVPLEGLRIELHAFVQEARVALCGKQFRQLTFLDQT